MKKNYLNCPVKKTLDIVGEKWTLLILRDFFLYGPRKFVDLKISLFDITPTTLSTRLKSLESNNILLRKQYSNNPPRFEYHLSDKGMELGHIVKSLYEWGVKYT